MNGGLLPLEGVVGRSAVPHMLPIFVEHSCASMLSQLLAFSFQTVSLPEAQPLRKERTGRLEILLKCCRHRQGHPQKKMPTARDRYKVNTMAQAKVKALA